MGGLRVRGRDRDRERERERVRERVRVFSRGEKRIASIPRKRAGHRATKERQTRPGVRVRVRVRFRFRLRFRLRLRLRFRFRFRLRFQARQATTIARSQPGVTTALLATGPRRRLGAHMQAPPATAQPDQPRAPTNVPRYLWQQLGFWTVLVFYVPTVLLVLLLSWGRGVHTLSPPLVRWWGRTMLRMVGVRLVVEPAAVAELSRRRRRVLTFNHASTMDIMVMTALWPNGTVAVVKREMLWIPLMGWAMYFLDFLPVNRGNHAKATQSLQRAAQRVRRGDLTLMIAPEGTRSRTGRVQPFKLGAFHLAAAADAPIVPLVLHGTRELWPRWQKQCNPGVVTVRMLPEQPSGAEDASAEAIHARADRLYRLYAQTLAEMERTVAV